MKTFRSRSLPAAALAFVLALLVGCANVLTTETRAIEAVTGARQVSTAMLRAGKITVAQDIDAQAKLDAVRKSIVAAKAAGDAQALDKARADADKVAADLEAKP